MGSACASCWTGEQPPRCWVAGSGCRRSTLQRRWALEKFDPPYSALSWCRQCWPFFYPMVCMQDCNIWHHIWHIWYLSLHLKCVKWQWQWGWWCSGGEHRVRGSSSCCRSKCPCCQCEGSGGCFSICWLPMNKLCPVRLAPGRPRSKPWDFGASACKRLVIALNCTEHTLLLSSSYLCRSIIQPLKSFKSVCQTWL